MSLVSEKANLCVRYFWIIAATMCGIAILFREYGGLFDGGGMLFWANVAVHCILLAGVPIGFVACSTLARQRQHLQSWEWWLREGVWKLFLSIYCLVFLYIVFFSAHME